MPACLCPQQVYRLAATAAPVLDAAWRCSLLARAIETDRLVMEYARGCMGTAERGAAQLVAALTAEITERLHCMLVHVYVVDGEEVFTMMGREKVVLPRKGAGIVSVLLDRCQGGAGGVIGDSVSGGKDKDSGPAAVFNDASLNEACHDPLARRLRLLTVSVMAVAICAPPPRRVSRKRVVLTDSAEARAAGDGGRGVPGGVYQAPSLSRRQSNDMPIHRAASASGGGTGSASVNVAVESGAGDKGFADAFVDDILATALEVVL